jgi:8-oxo-dGTP diphosphatase
MPKKISVAGVARRGNTVLVMRRLPGGSVGGLWEFPGGKTDPGESPEDALRREWMEETDLDIKVGDEIARGEFQHKGTIFTLIAFDIELPRDDSEPKLREHDAFDWINPGNLSDLPLVESDRGIAEIIFRELA